MLSENGYDSQPFEIITDDQTENLNTCQTSLEQFSHGLSETEPTFAVIGSPDINYSLVIKQGLDSKRIYDLTTLKTEIEQSKNDQGEPLWRQFLKNRSKGLLIILYTTTAELNENLSVGFYNSMRRLGLTSVYFWNCDFGVPVFARNTNKIELEQALKNEYSRLHSASVGIDDFNAKLESTKNEPPVSTGYNRLDEILDGGLYPGLYTFGADTSLGKSTFWLNIALNMSEKGRSVFYFSIEMSKFELTGRMLSRETYRLGQNNAELGHAQTCRTLTTFDKINRLSEQDRQLFEKAKITFKQKAKKLYLFENIGEVYPETIRNTVLSVLSRTGTSQPPVIIIDYVQILRSTDKYIDGNDKLKLDKNLFFFKKMSNDYRLPIVLISSLNRDSYKKYKRITMTSFKESGSVEYTSDVLIGMQLEKLAKFGSMTPEQASEELSNDVREIDVIVLKNRHGVRDVHTHFEYHTLFNDFTEVPGFNRYPVKDETTEYKPNSDENEFDDDVGFLE